MLINKTTNPIVTLTYMVRNICLWLFTHINYPQFVKEVLLKLYRTKKPSVVANKKLDDAPQTLFKIFSTDIVRNFFHLKIFGAICMILNILVQDGLMILRIVFTAIPSYLSNFIYQLVLVTRKMETIWWFLIYQITITSYNIWTISLI